jgi:hypothetical protein
MTALTAIPPDVRPVLEAYYRAKLAERFGASAPGPEQEAAFVREMLSSSENVVPLMDGREAVIGGGGAWDDEGYGQTEAASQGTNQKRNAGLFFVMVVVVVIVGYGEKIAGWVGLRQGGVGQGASDDGIAQELTPTPEITPLALPAGLDAVVSAMGIRVPLVVPRTLEISGASIPTVTFPIMPVQVDVADWPCPRQSEPVACWVYGTVVNYLIGIPLEQVAPELARDLGPGDVLRLRLSTERVVSFIVEQTRDEPRQNVEVLGQRRFGLTLVFLNDAIPVQGGQALVPVVDQGETRRVVWAAYDAQQDLFGSAVLAGGEILAGGEMTPTPAVGGGPTLSRQELTLGQTATLPDARVTPLAAWTLAGESSLRLRVENIGQATLSTAQWSAQLHTREGVIVGTIEEKQILAGQIDFVLCTAGGTGAVLVQGGAWEISTGAVFLAVRTD